MATWLGIPAWLLWGIALGAVFSTAVAVVFLVGERYLDPPSRDYPTGDVDGETRRRQEMRHYLGQIGERFAEDHAVAGVPVAFYLPERDVAITFDVETFFRIKQTDTFVILCEHEMPSHHLAFRLPFEVPEVETAASEVETAIRGAFEALDLTVGADPEEVDRAYRERVKEAHPDHGGSEEEFRRVREAYATAKEHAA